MRLRPAGHRRQCGCARTRPSSSQPPTPTALTACRSCARSDGRTRPPGSCYAPWRLPAPTCSSPPTRTLLAVASPPRCSTHFPTRHHGSRRYQGRTRKNACANSCVISTQPVDPPQSALPQVPWPFGGPPEQPQSSAVGRAPEHLPPVTGIERNRGTRTPPPLLRRLALRLCQGTCRDALGAARGTSVLQRLRRLRSHLGAGDLALALLSHFGDPPTQPTRMGRRGSTPRLPSGRRSVGLAPPGGGTPPPSDDVRDLRQGGPVLHPLLLRRRPGSERLRTHSPGLEPATP